MGPSRPRGEDRRPEAGRWVWVALGTLVLVGGGLRFAGDSSLWFDEVITLDEASRGSLLETVRAKVVHPPLVRVASRLSVQALGDPARPAVTDFALRLPSMLMGTLAIVFVFLFARIYSDDDDRVGLVAASAWALLPYGIWCSRDARFYAALVLFAAWTLWALAAFHRTPDRRRSHFLLFVPLVLGCYTHYLFGLLFLLTSASVLLLPKPRLAHLKPWVLAGLVFVPWVVFALPRLRTEDRSWVDPLADQLRNVPVTFVTGRLGYYHLYDHLFGFRLRDAVLVAVLALLVGGTTIHIVRRWHGAARLTAFVLFPGLAVTAVAHSSFVQTPFFHPKYLAFLYPFVCLVLGELAGFVTRLGTAKGARMRCVALAVAAPTLLAAVTTGKALRQVGSSHLPRQPYAQAAAWITQHRRDGDLVVILECSRRYNELALRHYGVEGPIAPLPCRALTEPLPSATRVIAVLTHWGSSRVRAAAVAALCRRYGPVQHRTRFEGIESDVVVLTL